MRLAVPQESAFTADISWPPPPLQKQSIRAAVLRVPKAIAGASGAYRVATAKIFQAGYASYNLNNQLSSREVKMARQPQMSSAQALARCICSAGRGSLGGNLGLRHHDLTSIIVPEISHRSQVDDLTCNGSSQTSRDGVYHTKVLSGTKKRETSVFFCGQRYSWTKVLRIG